jgi:hypothetical protein
MDWRPSQVACSTPPPHIRRFRKISAWSVTGVRSRWVCVAAGAILVLFCLIPKMSIVVASVPNSDWAAPGS